MDKVTEKPIRWTSRVTHAGILGFACEKCIAKECERHHTLLLHLAASHKGIIYTGQLSFRVDTCRRAGRIQDLWNVVTTVLKQGFYNQQMPVAQLDGFFLEDKEGNILQTDATPKKILRWCQGITVIPDRRIAEHK